MSFLKTFLNGALDLTTARLIKKQQSRRSKRQQLTPMDVLNAVVDGAAEMLDVVDTVSQQTKRETIREVKTAGRRIRKVIEGNFRTKPDGGAK